MQLLVRILTFSLVVFAGVGSPPCTTQPSGPRTVLLATDADNDGATDLAGLLDRHSCISFPSKGTLSVAALPMWLSNQNGLRNVSLVGAVTTFQTLLKLRHSREEFSIDFIVMVIRHPLFQAIRNAIGDGSSTLKLAITPSQSSDLESLLEQASVGSPTNFDTGRVSEENLNEKSLQATKLALKSLPPKLLRIDYCRVMCAMETSVAKKLSSPPGTSFPVLNTLYTNLLGVRYSSSDSAACGAQKGVQVVSKSEFERFALGKSSSKLLSLPNGLKPSKAEWVNARKVGECNLERSTLMSPHLYHASIISYPAVIESGGEGTSTDAASDIRRVASAFTPLLPLELAWRAALLESYTSSRTLRLHLRIYLVRRFQAIVQSGSYPSLALATFVNQSLAQTKRMKDLVHIKWAQAALNRSTTTKSYTPSPDTAYSSAASELCAAYVRSCEDAISLPPQQIDWTDAASPSLNSFNDYFGNLPEVLVLKQMPPKQSLEDSNKLAINTQRRTLRARHAPSRKPASQGEQGSTHHGSARVAICLVGVAQVLLTKAGHAESVRDNFIKSFGGAGSRRGGSSAIGGPDVFVVLVKPESKSDELRLQKQVMHYFEPVSFEWHNKSAGIGLLCHATSLHQYPKVPQGTKAVANEHHSNQLRQWAQCMDSIEKHELLATSRRKDRLNRVRNQETTPIDKSMHETFRYDIIVKARPDDIWYGPILPWCSFRQDTAYISRQVRPFLIILSFHPLFPSHCFVFVSFSRIQKSRYSDQFFILSRALAGDVLTMIRESFKKRGFVQCFQPEETHHKLRTSEQAVTPLVVLMDSKSPKPNFEVEKYFWEDFQTLAKKHQTKVLI